MFLSRQAPSLQKRFNTFEHIEPKVVLIDGKKLSELMIDFDVGVNTVASFAVKRVDSDYFIEE